MTALAAAAVLSLVTFVIAWILYLYTFPWLVQLRCVYKLHSIRDRVFNLGFVHPRVRCTLLYRDVDGFIASALYHVRSRNVTDALRFLALASPRKTRVHLPGWRVEQLAFELRTVYAQGEGAKILRELKDAVEETERTVMFRAWTGHPLVFCSALAGVLVAVPVLLIQRLARKTVKRVSMTFTAPQAEAHEVQALNDMIVGFDKPAPLSFSAKFQAPRLFYERVVRRGSRRLAA